MIIGTEAEFYIGVNTVTVGTQCILDLQSIGSRNLGQNSKNDLTLSQIKDKDKELGNLLDNTHCK